MTKNSALLFVYATLSATLVVGCGEGPQKNTTANQAVLRKKCESPRGYTPDASNEELANVLKTKFQSGDDKSVLTFVSVFKASEQTSLLDLSKPIVSAVSANEFSQGNSQISMQKNCETLTASLTFMGTTLNDLSISDIKTREISFSKTTDQGDLTVTVKKQGRTKVKVRSDLRFKAKDEEHQEALTLADFQAGNTITTVTLETSGPAGQKIEVTQITGVFDGSTQASIAPSARRLLANRSAGGNDPSAQAKLTAVAPTAEPGEKDEKSDVSTEELIAFSEVGSVEAAPTAAPLATQVEPAAPADASQPAASAAAAPGASTPAPGTET